MYGRFGAPLVPQQIQIFLQSWIESQHTPRPKQQGTVESLARVVAVCLVCGPELATLEVVEDSITHCELLLAKRSDIQHGQVRKLRYRQARSARLLAGPCPPERDQAKGGIRPQEKWDGVSGVMWIHVWPDPSAKTLLRCEAHGKALGVQSEIAAATTILRSRSA